MYKVFFNEKKISFAHQGNITLNKPSYIFDDFCSRKEVRNWFFSFIKSKENMVQLHHSNPEEFFKLFQSVFKVICAAGGVVIRKNKLLYIYRNGKWDLPKGKVEKGETTGEAALREVEEECGISNLTIIKQLPSTFHIYQSPHKNKNEEWIFKKTFWFEMEYSELNFGSPQNDEGITEIKWFAKNELNEVLSNTYQSLVEIIESYLD